MYSTAKEGGAVGGEGGGGQDGGGTSAVEDGGRGESAQDESGVMTQVGCQRAYGYSVRGDDTGKAYEYSVRGDDTGIVSKGV
jgi:hypothetical protein